MKNKLIFITIVGIIIILFSYILEEILKNYMKKSTIIETVYLRREMQQQIESDPEQNL